MYTIQDELISSSIICQTEEIFTQLNLSERKTKETQITKHIVQN